MKQFIIVLSFIGFALAGPPPPECLKGPETTKNIADCCKLVTMPESLVSKCKADNPPPPPGPPKGCCFSECILNETKILVNGNYDKAAAVTVLTQQMGGDDETKKVVEAAIDFCIEKSKGMKGDFDGMAKLAAPGEKVCNMMSGFMIGCVSGQVYKNCPSSKYTADAECDKIKPFVDKCLILLPFKI